MDGAFLAGPIQPGDRVVVLDSSPHSWTVRAVDSTCALEAVSNAVISADDDAICPVGQSTMVVAKEGAATMRLSWTEASDAARYNAYVGTLASLLAGAYDHVASSSGVTFPDAAVSTSGCDVSSGLALTARIVGVGAADAYFLLVPHGLDGAEGSHGLRSTPPFERRAADPRPPSTFCP